MSIPATHVGDDETRADGISLIIMDESIFYLDILEIVLHKMYELVLYLRHDGRNNTAKRGLGE
jgi:hypothetical protein